MSRSTTLTKSSKAFMSTSGISSPLCPQVYPSSMVFQPQISRTQEDWTVSRMAFEHSPWPLPESVQQGLIENSHQTHKLPPHGLPELRHSVASWYSKQLGYGYTAKNVSITTETNNILFHLQSAYDVDLILPSPSSESFTAQTLWMGQKVRWIHTTKENRYKLTAEQLYQEVMRAPERPRILVLSTPNVAGSSYSNDELEEMAIICKRFKMLCVSDERVSPLLFSGFDHHSMSSHYPEGTVVFGDSTWCGAGGSSSGSLGFMVFPDALEWVQNAMSVTVSDAVSIWTPLQYAMCSVFDHYDDGEIEQHLNVQRTIQSALAFKGFDAFQGIGGCTVHRPDGGFNIFVDFTEMDGVKELCSDNGSLSKMVLTECDVMALGPLCFGRNRDDQELSMRFSMVDFEGESIFEDAENIPDDVESEEMDAFIAKHCTKTVRGLDAVSKFMSHPTMRNED